MKRMKVNRFWLIVGLVPVTMLLHRFVAVLPIVVVIPVLFAYIFNRPWRYLLLVAVVAELFGVLAFGILSAVVLLPWLARLIFRKVKVDLAVKFFVVLAITVAAQLLILSWGEGALVWQEGFTPWLRILFIWTWSTLFLAITLLWIQNNRWI